MLRKPSPQQTELEMVALEQLVPGDHLLRKVEAAIDFGFTREMTERIETGARSPKIVKHNGGPILPVRSAKARPFRSRRRNACAGWARS